MIGFEWTDNFSQFKSLRHNFAGLLCTESAFPVILLLEIMTSSTFSLSTNHNLVTRVSAVRSLSILIFATHCSVRGGAAQEDVWIWTRIRRQRAPESGDRVDQCLLRVQLPRHQLQQQEWNVSNQLQLCNNEDLIKTNFHTQPHH